MSLIKKALVIFLFSIFSPVVMAGYNANYAGVIKDILVYTDSDTIYVILENMEEVEHQCSVNYFVIPSTITSERRQVILSRLFLAYSTREKINIGYDKLGGCIGNRIPIFRVG